MVLFCFENYSGLLWEKIVEVIERNFCKMPGGRPRIWKMFEITRIIYSNSERTEQFLEWNTFFKFVTGGFSSLISTFEQLKFQFQQIIEM